MVAPPALKDGLFYWPLVILIVFVLLPVLLKKFAVTVDRIDVCWNALIISGTLALSYCFEITIQATVLCT